MLEQKKQNQEQKKGQQNQNQGKQQNQSENQKKPPRPTRDNYSIYFHDKEVEVHIDYVNTILKLTGRMMANARYDIVLDYLDEDGKKQRLIINKAYVIAIRPLSRREPTP